MTKSLADTWTELKQKASGGIVAVRLGNWIEFFYEDASVVTFHSALNLTNRNNIPMAGLPISREYEKELQSLALKSGRDIYLFEHSADLLLDLQWEIVNIFQK